MLKFLSEHPYVLILVIYILASLFGKKKKPQAGGAKSGATRGNTARTSRSAEPAQTRPEASWTAGTMAQSNAEDSLRRVMEQADREFQRRQAGADAATSAQLAQMQQAVHDAAAQRIASQQPAAQPAAKSDAFEFHSLLNKGRETGVADSSRKDYDITGIDYDTQSTAFGFHPVVAEPVEKEYHLTGFQGFQSAQAFNAGERDRAESERAYSAPIDVRADILGGPGDLRRAIILTEILGKPRSMR